MTNISSILTTHRPPLAPYEALYKHFHANPELSFAESATAAKIASLLTELNAFDEVTTSIGGHGVAATLRNGPGPTVLLRADIDGLPVEERTGCEYASTARQEDPLDGVVKGVMHACGHDMHIAGLLAASETLVNARGEWSGTLVCLFQPAEEHGAGARAMVEDGLYKGKSEGGKGVPVPDVCIGAHVMPMRAGSVGTRRGLVASAADSLRITLHGTQGHASQPHRTTDPIVLAAHIITRLQTIVARELDPQLAAVVTVSSIHAGAAHNIIPDSAELKVNVRSFEAVTRAKVLASIKRIVIAECDASNAPRAPEFGEIATYPFTINDDGVTAAIEESFSEHFPSGKGGYDKDAVRLGGSEDFAELATAVGKPSCYFTYGGVDHAVWDKAEAEGTLDQLPVNHSPFFKPVVQPTLTTAVDGYVVAALTWLKK